MPVSSLYNIKAQSYSSKRKYIYLNVLKTNIKVKVLGPQERIIVKLSEIQKKKTIN